MHMYACHLVLKWGGYQCVGSGLNLPQSDCFPLLVTRCVLFLVGFGLLEDNWEASLD